MGDLKNLHLNETPENTAVAEAYFKSNDHTFYSDSHTNNDNDEYKIDKFKNKIFYKKTCNKQDFNSDDPNRIHNDEKESFIDIIRLLADEIKGHVELFKQLEFMYRGIPTQEVQNNDVTLLVNNLLYHSTGEAPLMPVYYVYKNVLVLDDSTSLYTLGFVAQLLLRGFRDILIVCTINRAVVSHAFTKLCTDVELPVRCIVCENPPVPSCSAPCLNNVIAHTVAVITERSDLDSAVDVIMSSTTKYPWKIGRILLQESIYDNFKKCISWKCKLGSPNEQPLNVSEGITQKCDEVFVHGEKTFLIDYVGKKPDLNNVILVQTYRTTKELLSMLDTDTFAISLWCSDISEANEIAYKANASIVWINTFAYFSGHEKASQAIYRASYYVPEYISKNLKVKSWNDLGYRRGVIDKHIRDNQIKFPVHLKDWDYSRAHSFVGVESGIICVGIEKTGIKLSVMDEKTVDLDILQFLLNGNIVILPRATSSYHDKYRSSSLPVYSEDDWNTVENKNLIPQYKDHFKVIWTSFGTIFAN